MDSKPAKKKFYPREKAIRADAPSRQKCPIPTCPLPDPNLVPDFRPKALSTTFTAPRNDPGDLDAVNVLGLHGLANTSVIPRIRVNNDAYIDLIESIYDQYASLGKQLERVVSQSTFVYYCVCLLHGRIEDIRTMQKENNGALARELRNALGHNVVIPKPVFDYLKSLGPFSDVNGRSWNIDFPTVQPDGYLGRVSEETHYIV